MAIHAEPLGFHRRLVEAPVDRQRRLVVDFCQRRTQRRDEALDKPLRKLLGMALFAADPLPEMGEPWPAPIGWSIFSLNA
jgi:hypothetical protein